MQEFKSKEWKEQNELSYFGKNVDYSRIENAIHFFIFLFFRKVELGTPEFTTLTYTAHQPLAPNSVFSERFIKRCRFVFTKTDEIET